MSKKGSLSFRTPRHCLCLLYCSYATGVVLNLRKYKLRSGVIENQQESNESNDFHQEWIQKLSDADLRWYRSRLKLFSYDSEVVWKKVLYDFWSRLIWNWIQYTGTPEPWLQLLLESEPIIIAHTIMSQPVTKFHYRLLL